MFYYKTVEENNSLWLLEEEYRREYIAKTESVFAQCNGHFGVRASLDFDGITQNRGMFISGLYGKAEKSEVTELVNCPDICEVELIAEGEVVSLDTGRLMEYARKLDVYTGELVASYVIELKNGRKIKVTSKRFASKDNLHLFCQELVIELIEGKSVSLQIAYGINGQITNSGASHFKQTECRVYDKECMAYQGMLCEDGLEVILAGRLTGSENEPEPSFQLKRRSIYKKQSIELTEKEPVTLFRVGYVREWSDVSEGTIESRNAQVKSAVESGYDKLFSFHKGRMDQFWQMADIKIKGASLEEKSALCFALYHLQGMVPSYTNRYSAGAKGLTGEGYKGHVFWDTEIFLLPFFYYTFPEVSKNLLMYRYHGIEGAKAKARDYGYKGSMFPWEAAKDGYEETPLYAALNIHTGKANKVWSGIKEHHVTADIVYAIMKYVSITKDWDFMKDYGAKIVYSAADFWVSRAVEQSGQLEILDIIGPDEYNEHIDNNTYTNYMAKYSVDSALATARKLNQEEKKEWSYFAEHILLPKENENGIIPQDDSFLEKKELPNILKYRESQVKQSVLLDYSRDEVVDMQVLKQADLVMLLNLFPGLFSPETVKKNVLFYEERTLHDSSLSYCAHAQACGAIGEDEMAWKFFQEAIEVDLSDNPYDSIDGIHSASLGGIWNCTIQGFAGISHDMEAIYCNPHLPKHWEEMQFSFVCGGHVIETLITKTNIHMKAKEAYKEPLKVVFNGKCYELIRELIINYIE